MKYARTGERKILHNHSRLSAGIDVVGFGVLFLLKNESQTDWIGEYRHGFIEKEDEFSEHINGEVRNHLKGFGIMGGDMAGRVKNEVCRGKQVKQLILSSTDWVASIHRSSGAMM